MSRDPPTASIPCETLALVGEALFGPNWQRPLARALGPHHPGGAREAIDDRLVRRWAMAQRDTPNWLPAALLAILHAAALEHEAQAEALRQIASDLAGVSDGQGKRTSP